MKLSVFRSLFIPASLFSGIFLVYLPLPGIGRLENIVWGSVYGLGWLIGGFRLDGKTNIPFGLETLAGLFGYIIWPILVLIASYLYSGRVYTPQNKTKSQMIVFSVLLSFLAVVPEEWIRPGTGWSNVPLYSTYMEAAY